MPDSVNEKGSRHLPARVFRTDTGIEVSAVTADMMREVDRIVITDTGPNLFQMMENAGRTLAHVASGMLGTGWKESVVVVLAGPVGTGAEGSARRVFSRTAASMSVSV